MQEKDASKGLAARPMKDLQVLKIYDRAIAETEVIHVEIQKYLINTSFQMLEKETNSLSKAFEMSNLRL
jgi:hypothetical protein